MDELSSVELGQRAFEIILAVWWRPARPTMSGGVRGEEFQAFLDQQRTRHRLAGQELRD